MRQPVTILKRSKIFAVMEHEWRRKFLEYHTNHPEVYTAFLQAANEVKAKGYKEYSAWTICTVIRYHQDIKRVDGEEFKLSNNYIGLYARLAVYEDFDRWYGFFTIKPGRHVGPPMKEGTQLYVVNDTGPGRMSLIIPPRWLKAL